MQSRRLYGRMNKHQQIVRELAVRILSGDISPGEILSAEGIASAEMDISRTAYREAVKVLTAKGLLESRPKVGTRVRKKTDWNMLDPDVIGWKSEIETTSQFVDDLFEFRQIIEPEAARLAARRGTPEKIRHVRDAAMRMAETNASTTENFEADFDFHNAILQASENELLGSLGHVVEALLLTSFELSAKRPGAREGSVPLHLDVWTHIQSGDAEQARAAMTALLKSARADLDKVLERDATTGTTLSDNRRIPGTRSTGTRNMKRMK